MASCKKESIRHPAANNGILRFTGCACSSEAKGDAAGLEPCMLERQRIVANFAAFFSLKDKLACSTSDNMNANC